MLVLATLSIIVAVLVPKFSAYKNIVKSELCHIKCDQLEKGYEVYLIKFDSIQAKGAFDDYCIKYGDGTCPDGGDISYVDGEVECNIHSMDGDSEGDGSGGDDGGVSYL
jgi:competence protein ComGC